MTKTESTQEGCALLSLQATLLVTVTGIILAYAMGVQGKSSYFCWGLGMGEAGDLRRKVISDSCM